MAAVDHLMWVVPDLSAAGWPVTPTTMSRTRPDGVTLSWHVALVPNRPPRGARGERPRTR